ncbi:hypothetical protein GGR28_002165 [Lewinella aquimaris]|uniref:Uncharacterized protein n=1 Tax=Neolewinella aquimaris TaxID=1835722 RepID=A0A840E374_9BACT|nr:hypothetical protein [Neolewinella aquimaris]MBB4079540.1 hypothetical protein [Neolewinella aquimaris]
MERSSTLDDGYGSELTLTRQDAANLRKAGKWGRFLGIVSMAFVGIFLLVAVLFGGTFLALVGATGGMAPFNGGGVLLTITLAVYAAIFLLLFYLSYLLYKFGAEATVGIDHGNSRAVSDALGALARLFKLYGILTIAYLGFTALMFFATLAAGAEAFIG